MYDPKAYDEEKLRAARCDFEAACDYRSLEQQEAHRAGRFIHNTNCTGQWEHDDLEALRSDGRPVLTFNIAKPSVNKAIGMHRDGMKRAQALPVGGEDAFVANTLNALADRAYRSAGLDAAHAKVMKGGYYHGESDLQLDVETDPDDPTMVKLTANVLPRYEVHWDPSSRKADRSDARYVFWDKWLSKGEFKKLYPDYADQFETLERKSDPLGDHEGRYSDNSSESGFDMDMGDEGDGYHSERWSRYYFESRRKMIRVVHAEYLVPEKRYWLTNSENGQREQVSEDLLPTVREMIEMGAMQGVELAETWTKRAYSLEFVGSTILFDDKAWWPWDGFSIDGFCFEVDSETGASYGMMRNLFDPQTEVNKAASASLEQFSGQSKPGVIAEKGAIEDQEQFEDAYRTAGGVSYVAKGALEGQRVIERQTAQVSGATEARAQNSVSMMQRISGVGTEMETPAAHAEAAATQMLRYHQARLGQTNVVEEYEDFLVRQYRRVLQTLLRAVPDAQLQRMLGNDEKYGIAQDPQTGETMVVEYDAGEQGQRQVKNAAPIGSLRDLQYDIELEVVSDDGSMRLVEAQHLTALLQAGVPVDPVLLVEKSTPSRHERERLATYAEQQSKAQAEQAQMQAQSQMQLAQQTIGIETAKVEEEARSNRMDETLKAQKQASDHAAKMAQVWESADATEKDALLKLAGLVEQRQARRTIDTTKG